MSVVHTLPIRRASTAPGSMQVNDAYYLSPSLHFALCFECVSSPQKNMGRFYPFKSEMSICIFMISQPSFGNKFCSFYKIAAIYIFLLPFRPFGDMVNLYPPLPKQGGFCYASVFPSHRRKKDGLACLNRGGSIGCTSGVLSQGSPRGPFSSPSTSHRQQSRKTVLFAAAPAYVCTAEVHLGSGELSKVTWKNGPVSWPFTS